MSTFLKHACCMRPRFHAPYSSSAGKNKTHPPTPCTSADIHSREESDFSEARREIHQIFQAVQERSRPKRKRMLSLLHALTARALPKTLSRKRASEDQEELRSADRVTGQRRLTHHPRDDRPPFDINNITVITGEDLYAGKYDRSTSYDPDMRALSSSTLSVQSSHKAASIHRPLDMCPDISSWGYSSGTYHESRNANSVDGTIISIARSNDHGRSSRLMRVVGRDGNYSDEGMTPAAERDKHLPYSKGDSLIACYHVALAEINSAGKGVSLKNKQILSAENLFHTRASVESVLSGQIRENRSATQGSLPLPLEVCPAHARKDGAFHAEYAQDLSRKQPHESVDDGASVSKRSKQNTRETLQPKAVLAPLDTREAVAGRETPRVSYTTLSRSPNPTLVSPKSSLVAGRPVSSVNALRVSRFRSSIKNSRSWSGVHTAEDSGGRGQYLTLEASAQEEPILFSIKPRIGRASLYPQAPNVEDASQLWERALQAHAYELSGGCSSPVTSQLGRRSISPGITALRFRYDITPRASLTMPDFAKSNYSDEPGVRRFTFQAESPTASRAALRRDSQYAGPDVRTIRIRRSFPAWSRFPSYTREQRNGSAGFNDHVRTIDFAMASTQPPSEPMLNSQKPSQTSPSLEELSIWRRWKQKYEIYTSDWRRFDKGLRSSISIGGLLSHPELEILPQMNPVFRPELTTTGAAKTARPQHMMIRGSSIFSGFHFKGFEQDHGDGPPFKRGSKRRREDEEEHISPLDPAPEPSQVARGYSLLHPNGGQGRCLFPKIPRKASTISFQTAAEVLPDREEDDLLPPQGDHVGCSSLGDTRAIATKSSFASFHTGIEWMNVDDWKEGGVPDTAIPSTAQPILTC